MKKIKEFICSRFIIKMMMISLGLLILPGLIVLFLSYYINYKSLNVYMSDLNQQLMQVASGEWEKSLEFIMGLPNQLYETNDALVMRSLRKETEYEAKEIAAVDNALTSMLLQSENILGIDIKGNNGYIVREYKFVSKSRWQTFAEQMDMQEGMNTFVLEGKPYFGVYHTVLTDFPTYDELAVINIYFSFDKWEKLAGDLGGRQDGYAVRLMTEDGRVLYEQGAKGIVDSRLSDGVYHQYKGSMEGNPGYYYMESMEAHGRGFKLIKFTPISAVIGIVQQIVAPVAVVNILLLLFMFLYLFFVYTGMMRPVKRIANNMKEVQKGVFDYKAVSKSGDEIGQMDQQYEKMVSDIDFLINQKMRNEVEITKSKLKTLQAQINPHFLNNILQTISTQALCESASETNKMICSLARMLQYNMEVDKEVVYLEEETANIRHYLKLQNQRYENRISCSIAQDQESRFVRVPKMILQPLIENAIKYSHLKTGGTCCLEVKLFVGDEFLHIQVSDDGQGISEAKKAEIAGLYKVNEMNVMEGHGIGFLNVLFRLRIFYGDSFHWEIRDNDPGCRIYLTMPREMQSRGAEDEGISGR